MPEEEKKTVDIDTSGPETEINVPEEKDEAVVDTAPETTEQETVTEEKVETEKKSDEELEDYSKGVQSRIEIEGGEVRLLNDDEVLATVQDPTDILHKF